MITRIGNNTLKAVRWHRVIIWTLASVITKITVSLLIIKHLSTHFGTKGVGQASNIMTLVAILDTLSGAGILNGINKFVAEFQTQPVQLKKFLGTASTITLTALLVNTCLLLCSCSIMHCWFYHFIPQRTLLTIVAIQPVIAMANGLRAILKGQQDIIGNAFATITGYLLGLGSYWFCATYMGYSGALSSIAIVPAAVLLPALCWVVKKRAFPLNHLIPGWHIGFAKKLLKFTLMTLISIVTFPIAYIFVRDLLISYYSWHEVGLWQGLRKISDCYFHITIASLSVYLLPHLARQHNTAQIIRMMTYALRTVLLSVMVICVLTWLLRDRLITLLFSDQFLPLHNLFIWQLIGDIGRAGAAVITTLLLAKGALFFYALAEGSLLLLMLGSSAYFIPQQGALGAVKAYCATYLTYLTLCLIVALFYLHHKR